MLYRTLSSNNIGTSILKTELAEKGSQVIWEILPLVCGTESNVLYFTVSHTFTA